MGCVATVRGALDKVPGIAGVDIEVDNQEFSVSYDPAKTDVDSILAALDASGESAKRK